MSPVPLMKGKGRKERDIPNGIYIQVVLSQLVTKFLIHCYFILIHFQFFLRTD